MSRSSLEAPAAAKRRHLSARFDDRRDRVGDLQGVNGPNDILDPDNEHLVSCGVHFAVEAVRDT
jgi:hypothetical protein